MDAFSSSAATGWWTTIRARTDADDDFPDRPHLLLRLLALVLVLVFLLILLLLLLICFLFLLLLLVFFLLILRNTRRMRREWEEKESLPLRRNRFDRTWSKRLGIRHQMAVA